MSENRFKSWEEEAKPEIGAVPKPEPEVKPAPVFKKQEPSNSPEDIVAMISDLDDGEELCLELSVDVFNKIYSIVRKSKLYSNLPSYTDGKLKFIKN